MSDVMCNLTAPNVISICLCTGREGCPMAEDAQDRECSRCGDAVQSLSTDDLCDGCVHEDAVSSAPNLPAVDRV